MMQKSLENYVMVLQNRIPNELCEATIADIPNLNAKKATFLNYSGEAKVNPGEEERLEINADEAYPIKTRDKLMEIIWNGLDHYYKHYNFDWHNSWNGFTIPKFNIYNETSLMTEHIDHIHSCFDGNVKGIPILSVIGLLNDEFEGGDFVMFTDTKIPLSKGDLLIFPSVFLYPHKVETITKGTRYSLVSWVY